jgi:hypothetical protein
LLETSSEEVRIDWNAVQALAALRSTVTDPKVRERLIETAAHIAGLLEAETGTRSSFDEFVLRPLAKLREGGRQSPHEPSDARNSRRWRARRPTRDS